MVAIGAIIGSIAGYAYWKFVGCNTGTCMITSNPWRSTIYFALFGATGFSLIPVTSKIKKDTDD